MADKAGEKKHPATEQRRQKAREEGNVARSNDLASSVLLLIGILLLDTTGPGILTAMVESIREAFSPGSDLFTDNRTSVMDFVRIVSAAGFALLPLLAGLLVTSIVVNYAQVGPLWLTNKINLDITRIDPLKGFQRIVSLTNFTRLGFGLLKIGIVAGLLIFGLWARWDSILSLGATDIQEVGRFVWSTMIELSRNVAIALVVLAVADYAFQRWKYEQDLRMTDEEMREELKMSQGDPQMKARRRKLARDISQQRLAADVPQADVVVTNPTELAIARRYDPKTMRAPIVLAKGADLVAARIRKIALASGVPLVERKPLAQALYRHVEVGEPIPSEEYAAVAEVLKYVYQIKGKTLEDLTGADRPNANSQSGGGPGAVS